MAYYTGTANDLSALRQALIDACGLEGWAWDSGNEVLSKGTMFLRLQVVSGYMVLLGRTSATAGSAPSVVRIGQFDSTPLTWPATYEIFVFAGEVYLVVNYGVDYYQWCAFGQSTVEGLPGSGMFFAASLGSTTPSNATSNAERIILGATFGGGASTGQDLACPALNWSTYTLSASFLASRNCFVHSNLDSAGWLLGDAGNESLRVGVGSVAPLIGILPNSWNSEAVLLPIRIHKHRPSYKVSMVADLEHARYTRVDNYMPGEIVTIGSDRWKVFPWYRRNVSTRNASATASTIIGHTGTFGWAIRYEGP